MGKWEKNGVGSSQLVKSEISGLRRNRSEGRGANQGGVSAIGGKRGWRMLGETFDLGRCEQRAKWKACRVAATERLGNFSPLGLLQQRVHDRR